MLEVWGLNGLYSLRGPNFAKEFPARSLNWRVIGEVSPPSQDGTESFIYMAALVYFIYMDIGKGVSNVSIYRESLRKTQNLRVSWEWRHWSPHLWIQFQVSVMSEGMRKRMCWGPSVFLQGHNTFFTEIHSGIFCVHAESREHPIISTHLSGFNRSATIGPSMDLLLAVRKQSCFPRQGGF